MTWEFFVYVHRRADTGDVFYVGKGRLKSGRPERAYAFSKRSKFWNRVSAKAGGVEVEIVASCRTDYYAQELEKALIAQYGRRDLGLGQLVNLTDGGDGHAGLVVTEKKRRHLSELASRPRTRAWIESIRRARKDGGNGGVVKRGDKLPEEWRASISAAKIGTKNPMYGKTGADHPKSRRVVDTATGCVYESVTEAAAAAGLKMKTLSNMLNGHRKNKTNLRMAS